jgi:hypothetical protein
VGAAEAAKRGLPGPIQIPLNIIDASFEDVVFSLVKEKIKRRQSGRSPFRFYRFCVLGRQGLP